MSSRNISAAAASLRDAFAGFSFSFSTPPRSSTPTSSKGITRLHGHIAAPRRNLEMVEFSTPQRITMKERREHEAVEFWTPQHPLAGSNNWGGGGDGDSPLLSLHVPGESLLLANYFRCPDDKAAAKTPPEPYPVYPSPACRGWPRRRRWGFSRLTWRWLRGREMTTVYLGGGKVAEVAEECSGYVSQSRWPQGW